MRRIPAPAWVAIGLAFGVLAVLLGPDAYHAVTDRKLTTKTVIDGGIAQRGRPND